MAAEWQKMDAWLKARGIRITAPTPGTTQPPRPVGHTSNSWHYFGQARDYGTYGSDCWAIFRALEPFAQGRNPIIIELFWRDLAWNDGYRVGAVHGHYDHVHAAMRKGANLPGGGPAPQPQPQPPPAQKGFLMALTDAQQGDVYNMLTDLQQKANFGGNRHPNFGDLVNEVVKQVNAHVDIKIAEAIATLKK